MEATHLPYTRCGNAEFHWGERTYIMGICNLTPDSFSGDGLGDNVDAAVLQAKKFVADGADIIDVGGESTRPGAPDVSADEESRRIIPVIKRLASELSVPVSVDTYKAEVARRAVEAGAKMINDVWGLARDPALARVAAEAGVPIVIASNQRNKAVSDIMTEVISSLEAAVKRAVRAGVKEENIIIDPGIGFGKTVDQNLEIIRRLAELKVLRKPILLGTSRKFALNKPPNERLEATAATLAIGIANGADMIRVHDFPQMVLVARMSDAIVRRRLPRD